MTLSPSYKYEHAASDAVSAVMKARVKHGQMRSPHEGYAILLEEVDELWDEVRRWQPDIAYRHVEDCAAARQAMRKEALHVAAMALAFLAEVCDS